MLTARYRQRSLVGLAERAEVIYLWTALRYRVSTVNPGVLAFCMRRLREFDVAHIYGVYDFLGPIIAGFCRRWNIPYVLEPVGMFRPIVRNIALKKAYRRLFGWPLILGAAKVIATSDLERDELVAEGVPHWKVAVRRNGVELPTFSALPLRGTFRREIGVKDEEPLILYLGRLSKKKGLDLLVSAFSGIASPATLAIVGPDDGDGCVQEIASLRGRLGLDGRLRLLGPRFDADKLAAFADADIFVLPSRSENFGNAAAEAIACSVPVVVTDRCGIAPMVRDRAGLVVPCEVGAIRGGLRRLLEDSALRDRLSAGAAQVRAELAWDEPIAQLEQLYLDLVKARGRGPH